MNFKRIKKKKRGGGGTSDLSDALESVFERAQSAGVTFALALGRQPELQLLDGLHELLLRLQPRRLVAAAAGGGGGVVLRAGGQQAVGQGAPGGGQALRVGAERRKDQTFFQEVVADKYQR